jgi:hypothetical protein
MVQYLFVPHDPIQGESGSLSQVGLIMSIVGEESIVGKSFQIP